MVNSRWNEIIYRILIRDSLGVFKLQYYYGFLFLCVMIVVIKWKKLSNFISDNFDSGKGGIRTLGTVARTPHFECGPFDHSGISPFFSAAKVQKKEELRAKDGELFYLKALNRQSNLCLKEEKRCSCHSYDGTDDFLHADFLAEDLSGRPQNEDGRKGHERLRHACIRHADSQQAEADAEEGAEQYSTHGSSRTA